MGVCFGFHEAPDPDRPEITVMVVDSILDRVTTNNLRARLAELLFEGKKKFVLVVSKKVRIDSRCLDELASILNLMDFGAHGLKPEFVLVHYPPVFHLFQRIPGLRLFESQRDAIVHLTEGEQVETKPPSSSR